MRLVCSIPVWVADIPCLSAHYQRERHLGAMQPLLKLCNLIAFPDGSKSNFQGPPPVV